jgi:hypothetical protein
MRWPTTRTTTPAQSPRCLSLLVPLVVCLSCALPAPGSALTERNSGSPENHLAARVALGRQLVMNHGCGGCHGGGDAHPGAPGWLQGVRDTSMEFQIGPFRTRPRNLTPDNATGLGRFSERQIFNALRYGLRPEETADVDVTSSTPGEGNFPLHPRYLAPPMPWPAFRHMSDEELYAIAAYLKNGLKPVVNRVAESEGPPDFWASVYTAKLIGTYPIEAYPTVNERR